MLHVLTAKRDQNDGCSNLSQGDEVQSVWPQFSKAFVNSVITSLGATLLTVVIAALGAYAFVRIKFPFRDTLFLVVVATMAIPAYTVMIPFIGL